MTNGANRKIPARLIGLLQQEAQESPGSQQERDKLHCALCEALGHCASPEALAALRKFMEKNKDLPEAVETAARIAVQQLMLEVAERRSEGAREKGRRPPTSRSTILHPPEAPSPSTGSK